MATTSSASNSLKQYLRKYTSNNDKKKIKKAKLDYKGVIIVDEDPIWHKPVHDNDDFNLSPPRRQHYQRKKKKNHAESDRKSLNSTTAIDQKPPIAALNRAPKVGGLISNEEIKEEIRKKRIEDWLKYKDMVPPAEAVYRDKLTGKRISKEEFMKSQKKPRGGKLESGKVSGQKRKAEVELQEIKEEKDKPFDLDKWLKERDRWGDPMAFSVKKKH